MRPQRVGIAVTFVRAGGGGEASQTAAAAQPTGTGWGSLKGKFVYAGDPPSPTFLPRPRICSMIGRGSGSTSR